MAKLTKKRVLDVISQTCDVQNWDAWNDVDGNAERTKINHLLAICSIKDCINTISVFETHFPDGVAEVVEECKKKYEQFRQQFIKTYPDDFVSYSLTLDLSPIGAEKYNPKKDPAEEVKKFCGESKKDKTADDEIVAKTSEYANKTLRELRKLCRERDITIPSGAAEEDLIALLEESDESGDQSVDNDDSNEEESETDSDENASDSKEEEESEEEEPEDGESLSYDEMEISELRAECKKRGIEFSKNTKAHVLIDLLTEDDKKSEEAEDAKESDAEVDELDEVLDEEFVDEEIEAAAKDEEESKSAKSKRNKK